MPNYKNKKFLITEAVLAQLPYTNQNIDEIIKSWWMTKHSDGLRLTPDGDKKLREAEIEYFDLPLKVQGSNWYKFVTDTSRKIDCPYFIGLNKNELGKSEPFIRLYDSKIAMLITLYGNIFEYMDSVKVKYDRRKEK